MTSKINCLEESQMTPSLRKRLSKSLYYDPRASAAVELDLYPDNINSVIPYRVPVQADVFAAPILAAVSYALQRGWSINSNRPSDPYHAATYMIQLLIACAQNETPEMMSVPVWLHWMCQAVTERTVKARAGQMDYSFDVQTEWLNPATVTMGPTDSAIYSLENKGPLLVNGLFSTSVAPVAYTEELGAQAAQAMWLYLKAMHPNSPMHHNISIGETSAISRDASAYAIAVGAPGGGFAGLGAWFKRLELEVPVRRPLFSVFSGSPFSRGFGDPSRAANYMRNFSCDGFLLGGMLVGKLMPHQTTVKNWPRPHFVDFNEMLDVLAQACTLAIELRLSEKDTRDLIEADPTYYPGEVQCPLTLQEVGLLLRATLMTAFDDSQLMGQGTYPRSASRGDNEFVSFVCGANTCPQSGASLMRIPVLLKQNVLALRQRVINASRSGSNNPQVWFPILGQYEEDILNTENYFNIIEGETQFNTFFFDPEEDFISYVDGSTSSNDVVWINDPAAITKLAERWNEWTVRMGNYFWSMDTIGSDQGVDPLFSCCMTLHWAEVLDPVNDAQKGKTKNGVKKIVTPKKVKDKDTMLKRWTTPLTSPSDVYLNRRAFAVSSAVKPFKNAWEGVQQMFVFPCNKVAPIQANDPRTYSSYTAVAAYQNEEFQIPLGSGDQNFVSQADRHIIFATQMVKQIWADKDSTQKVIEQLEMQGDAGDRKSVV